MSDEPDNLVLVYLRRMDGKLDQLADVLAVHSRRLTAVGIAIGNMAGTEMSHYANTALRAGRVDERSARIERRLDLVTV